MTNTPSLQTSQLSRIVLVALCLLLLGDISVSLYQGLHGIEEQTQILKFSLPGLAALLLIISGSFRNRLRDHGALELTGDFFDYLDQFAIVVDNQGVIRNINKAAANSIDKAPAELVGQAVHAWFHPDSFEAVECPICQHISAGKSLPATDFHFSNHTWQQISLTPYTVGDSSEFIQFHIDVSARKQIEEQLALVIDGAELGYWDWNYLTGKHSVNQRWLDMLGLSPDELDHYVSDWDKRLHPEDRERVQTVIAKHIESNRPYVVEFRMRHKRGHWVWIQGSGAVVAHDPISGGPSRLCGTHQDISVRKQSEHNLQRAYQIISQSAAVVLKWNNSEGLPIEFATENARQLFGYSVEHLITGNVFYLNLLHPDDIGVFLRELASADNDPDCWEITHQPYRVITQNGGVKWVQDRKMLVRNEQGKIVDYQGLVTDITQQRQQTSAIRNIISSNLRQNANSLLDNLTLLAAETLGADFALIAEVPDSGHARSLSMCARGKIVANRRFSLWGSPCSEVASGVTRCLERDAATQYPNAAWLRRNQVDGYLGVPLLDKQQNSFGFISVSYCRPIPDIQFATDTLQLFALQITAELERSRAIDALQDQKQRLLDAQSISHIGDWRWHLPDNHFSWSDEMYRITATDKSLFTPTFSSILTTLIHPDDRHLFKMTMQNGVRSGTIDFRHRIVLNDNQLRHVHQRGKVIRDTQHKIVGIQGTMQDITDRLHTEQRLLEAKQQAEQATRVKSEFLANMSHEIRTPMNAIIGLVELCLNSKINVKQRDYLERVETASRSLMTIIDDILDFSKMEAGKLNLESTPFLLEEVLDNVFSTMSELCASKGIKLIIPPAHQNYHAVIGDPQRLRQVFINLIGNAIKFTEAGEVRVYITEIGRSEQQTHLQFSISDTGIGMNAEKQAKLFQAFSQGDSSITRNYGGTGLGLIISKQLVEQMGGTISVFSQEHIGSTFTFSVKLGITCLASVRQAQCQQRRPVVDTQKLQRISGAKVLLVEDNEVNRIVAIELLEQAHVKVDTAENGEIALSKLKQNSYDCVLMDVQMPVMDGYETTKQLRSIPGCHALPVIAMTANAMSNDRDRCVQADMNDFISKPILPEKLYAALIKWLLPRTTDGEGTSSAQENEYIPAIYGIDQPTGLQHTAGNRAVYRKILLKFAENHSETLRDITLALVSNNHEKAHQLVHTLKGLVGSLGAEKLQSHLICLEELLTEYRSDPAISPQIDSTISKTALELAKVIDSINAALGNAQQVDVDQPCFSQLETRQQLAILIRKLQTFDSDSDQQLDQILLRINDKPLVQTLLPIKKQIANYQFIDAAQALNHILENQL